MEQVSPSRLHGFLRGRVQRFDCPVADDLGHCPVGRGIQHALCAPWAELLFRQYGRRAFRPSNGQGIAAGHLGQPACRTCLLSRLAAQAALNIAGPDWHCAWMDRPRRDDNNRGADIDDINLHMIDR